MNKDKIINVKLEFTISESEYNSWYFNAENHIEFFLSANYKATDFKWTPERREADAK